MNMLRSRKNVFFSELGKGQVASFLKNQWGNQTKGRGNAKVLVCN